MKITYAQNGEDIVLARAFPAHHGRYIDVGAASPTLHSVTKLFYDRGWRGVNVEPLVSWYEELERERPNDVNVLAGVSDRGGTAEFFDLSAVKREESTLDRSVADRHRDDDVPVVVATVPVLTLDDVFALVPDQQPIDFVKIDVEGWEAAVIRGCDWTRHRPAVLVVEAIDPLTHEASHEAWEPELIAADYQVTLFDGLNRFYVAAERRDLIPSLSVPASVVDGYTPHATVLAAQERAAEIEALEGRLCAAAAAHRSETEQLAEHLRRTEQRVADLSDELAARAQELASAGTDRVADLERRLDAIREELRRSIIRESDWRLQFEALRAALDATD